ncbi:MFS transporter [Bacillus aerolatus]|uniref:MFS transporter n=1 Tax=Bacillus aerolatus TaxID=2653354 RepID=A0A6I1FEM1_9BACI|nr:MFS transporter [Bacillus aerolatus]KAB7706225.1 MFS transporter [Bacillus aerolatus]
MNQAIDWKRNFFILWGGQFMAIAGLTVLVPLLPFYMEELGVKTMQSNQLWSGISLAAPAVSSAIASPFWGKLGDRFGRKLMVVRALFGLSACLFLMAIVTSPLQFLFVRLFQGAFGGVVDASSAFAGSEAPKEQRGKALGSLQGAVAAGSLSGPLLGGIFIDLYGFRPLLMVMGVLTGIGAIAAWFLLTERNSSKNKVHFEKAKDSIFQTFADLLSHPRTRGFIIVGFAANLAVFGLVTPLAPLVEKIAKSPDYAATWIGFLQAALWTATLLSSPWWGKQNDRSKVERNYMIATAICGISVILQACSANVPALFAFRVLQGLTFSALIQSVMLVVVQASTDYNRGARIGATNSLLVCGQIVGSLTGALITGIFKPEIAFLFMGIIFIGSALLLLRGFTISRVFLFRVNKR